MPSISVNYVTARPTRGSMIGIEGKHLLEPTLKSLKEQTFKNFEFVCVDILYEKRPDMLEEFELPFPFKHVSAKPDWWLEKGVWSGAAPRNKGIAVADDDVELIVVLDDCCEFGSDFLQQFWNWYQRGYFAMALTLYNMGGKPLYYDNESKKQIVEAQVKDLKEGYSESLDKVHNKGERFRDSRWTFVERSEGIFYPPPQMYYGYSSVSMEAILKVNGYDEKLDGDKSLIDVDLGLRLAQARYNQFVLDEKLTVTENAHHGIPSEILFWDGGVIKSNYNIMNLNQRKNRWKANSYVFTLEEADWIRTFRDPLERHLPVWESSSRQYNLFMEWIEKHQRVFDLRELRLLE